MTFERILLIRELFSYNDQNGEVSYKSRYFGPNPSPRQKQWNTRFTGKICGYLSQGYIRCSAFGKVEFYAHQIAFALMSNFIPEEVDHINLCRSDNKWSNLRAATRQENACNCRKRKTNKSGLKGVSWSKSNSRWRMDFENKGVRYCGYYNSAVEAYEAYCLMSKIHHKEFGNAQ